MAETRCIECGQPDGGWMHDEKNAEGHFFNTTARMVSPRPQRRPRGRPTPKADYKWWLRGYFRQKVIRDLACARIESHLAGEIVLGEDIRRELEVVITELTKQLNRRKRPPNDVAKAFGGYRSRTRR